MAAWTRNNRFIQLKCTSHADHLPLFASSAIALTTQGPALFRPCHESQVRAFATAEDCEQGARPHRDGPGIDPRCFNSDPASGRLRVRESCLLDLVSGLVQKRVKTSTYKAS